MSGLVSGGRDQLFTGLNHAFAGDECPQTSNSQTLSPFYRLEGRPAVGTCTFTDVPEDEWYTGAMAWAVAEKLINGIGNNQVDPQGDAVRAQMAAILCRFCENVVK